VAALWSELVLVLAELGSVSDSDDLAYLLAHGPQAGLRVLAATADRDSDRRNVGRVPEELQCTGALAVDDVPVVVRVDEDVPRPLRGLDELGVAVGEGDALADHLGAQSLGCGHLGRVRAFRDEDQRRQTSRPGGQRHRLGMVAGAGRDHAGSAWRQLQDGVERAPHLE